MAALHRQEHADGGLRSHAVLLTQTLALAGAVAALLASPHLLWRLLWLVLVVLLMMMVMMLLRLLVHRLLRLLVVGCVCRGIRLGECAAAAVAVGGRVVALLRRLLLHLHPPLRRNFPRRIRAGGATHGKGHTSDRTSGEEKRSGQEQTLRDVTCTVRARGRHWRWTAE